MEKEIRTCIICRQPLKETEEEVCHNCSSKFHLDEGAPTVVKIRKKRREE